MDEVSPSGDGIEACCQLHVTFGFPVVLLGEDSSDKLWRRMAEAADDFYLTKHSVLRR